MFGSTSKSLVMWFRQNSLKSTSCKKRNTKIIQLKQSLLVHSWFYSIPLRTVKYISLVMFKSLSNIVGVFEDCVPAVPLSCEVTKHAIWNSMGQMSALYCIKVECTNRQQCQNTKQQLNMNLGKYQTMNDKAVLNRFEVQQISNRLIR